ncbi:MAG TPA: tRNA adenosine(34) deaminase TadA [Gammaproteobacteria bacterium]|jgi:tRNA(Arg) A34 adenosine deaminase TadA|nr:tRNA adenosine(34) deaminase TadA [Gammaproteobacteria bacterium]
MRTQDEIFMRRALELAREGAAAGEVPVGAVLVLDNQIIGEGFNAPISGHDPSAHAEIQALRKGAAAIGNYRLLNSTLYVTLEPCMMCTGAMVHARIQRLVYAATDPKAGVIKSKMQLLDQPFLNHRVAYEGGVLESECGSLLTDFFRSRR